jgi:uncharacterized protein (DUF1015 family)
MNIQPLSLLTPRIELVPSMRDLAVQVKDKINAYMSNGWYKQMESSICIYQIAANGHTHTGILALNDINDFDQGKIKKHEKTLTKREEEYFELLRSWKAVIKPVLLTFAPNDDLTNWMNTYLSVHTSSFRISIPEYGEVHHYWLVTDLNEIKTIQAIFENIPAVYIADGHHRTTAIANMSKRTEEEKQGLDFSHLFAAYFPDDQLDILGYHRIAALENEAAAEQLIVSIKNKFGLSLLQTPRLPLHKREVIVVYKDQFYTLDFSVNNPQSEVFPAIHDTYTLDTALLNDLVFTDILGVENVRSDKRITYMDGASGYTGMLWATQNDYNKIGFLLFPVAIEDLYYLSDQGDSLPPKSTWFEPRIRSGLAVCSLLQA